MFPLTKRGRSRSPTGRRIWIPSRRAGLFDRFYTVESGCSATGLGLSIAKTLTEQMGGNIGAVLLEGSSVFPFVSAGTIIPGPLTPLVSGSAPHGSRSCLYKGMAASITNPENRLQSAQRMIYTRHNLSRTRSHRKGGRRETLAPQPSRLIQVKGVCQNEYIAGIAAGQCPAELRAASRHAWNTQEEVQKQIDEYEKKGVIRGYHALINWEKSRCQPRLRLIELRVTPKRNSGFDEIADKIMQFEEVESVYLMSGGFDLAVRVNAPTMQDIAPVCCKAAGHARIGPLHGHAFHPDPIQGRRRWCSIPRTSATRGGT